jgi:cystathionine beta-lyase/cystathionine gamma-synthase
MHATIDPHDIDICLDDDAPPDVHGAAPMAMPIWQTSLFAYPTFEALLEGLAAEDERHVYTRGRNPTVEVLERKIAALERGEACKCFGSGMGAISAVMLGLLSAGDHILFVNHTYGPTLQLAAHLERFGISHDLLLDVGVDAVAAAIRPATRLIYLESPGTMLLRMMDVPAIAALARARGIVTCLDNSWATPLFQKPLTAGVDVVVHSCTKYIGGHSDVVGGAVVTSAERLRQIFFRAFLLNGAAPAPVDAWLLLRGLRTLPVRMRQHMENGWRVAEFLQTHRAVARVFHPGFAADRDLARRQLTGYSGLLSFELTRARFEDVAGVIDRLRRFRRGVSWGGVESLVISPRGRHNDAQLAARGIPPGLIRLSIGLEDVDLLIADLAQSLDAV